MKAQYWFHKLKLQHTKVTDDNVYEYGNLNNVPWSKLIFILSQNYDLVDVVGIVCVICDDVVLHLLIRVWLHS